MEFINNGTIPELEDRIVNVIKTCYDPEIPVDIFELGLIYKVEVMTDNFVEVDMTLTSPNCPAAESLPADVEDRIRSVEGVKEVVVNIVFEPPWDKSLMSEIALLELGFM